jgi:hypothetical protein
VYLRISSAPQGTVGVLASGEVTRRDRSLTLEPAIAEAMAAGTPLRLLYVVGSDFQGYDHGGPYEPAIFGSRHFTDFGRIAFLAAEGRYARAVRLMDGLMPAAIRVFNQLDLAPATRWLATGKLSEDAPLALGPAFADAG